MLTWDHLALRSESQLCWEVEERVGCGHHLQQGCLFWASLQAKKTYQVYHTESMSAEAKLREAERQEEKRTGRSAAAAAAATAATTEAGPLRKTSLKKGSRLVEKVGLEGTCLSPKALAPGLCPCKSLAFTGACWKEKGKAEDGKATDLWQGCRGQP